MYYFFKQGNIPSSPLLSEGMQIQKRMPVPLVKGMNNMQIGYRRFVYFLFFIFIYKGIRGIFKEYDLLVENKIVAKVVLISKVPIYKFLPWNGIHICYCETIPEARGKGYYPLLLSYVQNEMPNKDFYMIAKCDNHSSIKGIEKAGFIKYAQGIKNADGVFLEKERYV